MAAPPGIGRPSIRFSPREQGQAPRPDEPQEQLTPVMTRLGTADLAAVDTLIAAGIAGSRAEILRWAVSRIRVHPAYAQLQDRVHEISQLKAQF
jgi:predicted ArsR family transcriptional regulator